MSFHLRHAALGLMASGVILGSAALAQQPGAAPATAAPDVTPEIPGVVAKGTRITLVKDGFTGTEGPISLADGSLLFTENQANRVIHLKPDGSTSTFLDNTNGVNSLALAGDGTLYAVQTLQTRVGVVAPADKVKVLADNYEGLPFGRPNDLVLDGHGNLYFTDSGANPRPGEPPSDKPVAKPAVYRIGSDGALTRIAADIERPNGIQLSPDEKTLYVANTNGESVLAYDIGKGGKIGPRRDFAKLDGVRKTETGVTSGADGLAVDAKGQVYVATSAGIQVFSGKGKALGTITLPKAPQNLAFAGADKKTLYAVGRGAVYEIAVLTPGYSGRAK